MARFPILCALAALSFAEPANAEPFAALPPQAVVRSSAAAAERKPPPLYVDYASYGVAGTADVLASAGATCREGVPCILGSGGGLIIRGGYRSPGPWYIGGAYQISKTNSSNLYRFATLQQLRAEMRYMVDLGWGRTVPYVTWGAGGVVYGNEWGVETGGAGLSGGLGLEMHLSRLALLGVALVWQPIFLAGFKDTADFERDPGLAQYVRIELQLEIRSELSRR